MRLWLATISKTLWGIYLILTSAYCLLGFLPYTYVALIKEPPYEWLPWFAHHQGALYFLLLALVAVTHWPKGKQLGFCVFVGVLTLAGTYLAVQPFLPGLEDNWTAYKWSLASLIPLVLLAAFMIRRDWPDAYGNSNILFLPYSRGILAALFVATIYQMAVELHNYVENRSIGFASSRLEIAGWSVISHAMLAVVFLSALNLIRLISRRTKDPAGVNIVLVGTGGIGVLWVMLYRLLSDSLSFQGWAAQVYAACLAAAVTMWLASLVMPFLAAQEQAMTRGRNFGLWITVLASSILAVVLPTVIAGSDWDGVLQNSFALVFWIALAACFFTLRPRRKLYASVSLVAVLVLSGVAYKGLQATEILWAGALGKTDDDVARALENYANQDASFRLAQYLLGNGREEACGDLCRILRENANVRDAEVKADLQLVDHLAPSRNQHPNIFLFVIDSLRPDYLGAYNSRVDFTPNLDAFADESVVVHNAYTQYAGTSLSEPAIWAGSLLLHAHYLQPFARVNSLEKLARADDYRMVVSYDEILRQLLAPNDDLIKLDTDKKLWNQLEVCSTIRQLEPLLANGLGHGQPVLFYTQPKNVHQFAHNDLPLPDRDNWRTRPGFNNRIAHEVHQVDGCLGDFFAFLKAKGLYDNSVIILTSDHGDATGELGRSSHSLSIYPEVMRVPLIVHLPPTMRRLVHDDRHLSALTDITPSLYYLLGHGPIKANPLFGHPLFVEGTEELDKYRRTELFLASDERAVFGLLTDNGRFLYTTYDSPTQSFLYDLDSDPQAQHNILTDSLKKRYDERIIAHLHEVAEFYGYRPGVGSLLAAAQ